MVVYEARHVRVSSVTAGGGLGGGGARSLVIGRSQQSKEFRRLFPSLAEVEGLRVSLAGSNPEPPQLVARSRHRNTVESGQGDCGRMEILVTTS